MDLEIVPASYSEKRDLQSRAIFNKFSYDWG
jgi:hypothetical protein